MDVAAAASMIKEVPGMESLKFRLVENDGGIFLPPKFHDPSAPIARFSAMRFGDELPIPIPSLVDQSLYGEWMDRMIRVHLKKEVVPYETYQVKYPVFVHRFDMYECDEFLITSEKEPGNVHQCLADLKNDKVRVRSFLRIEGKGCLPTPFVGNPNPLLGHFSRLGDFYKHPGNTESPFWDQLEEVPKDSYVGQNLFYCPSITDEDILIRVGDSWIWTDYNSFCARAPQSYIDELSLIKALSL